MARRGILLKGRSTWREHNIFGCRKVHDPAE
jgi:hypothetical protein